MLSNVRYGIIIFATCFFHLSACFCQAIENRFVHYTPKDGLPDGVVRDIRQDSAGYLWIATSNGIAKFDGHDFKIFRHLPYDTTSICENNVGSIYLDSENHLWFTSYNWLYLYHSDGEWFERFHMEGYDLLKIQGEEKGQLILVCRLKGMYKFDIREKKLYEFNHKSLLNGSTFFYHYMKDDEGFEWFRISGATVRYDPNTDQALKITDAGGAMLTVSDSIMVCATFLDGLFLINRKTLTIKQFLPDSTNSNSLPDNCINCLYRLNDSITLVGTNKGLCVFNWRRQTFHNIRHEPTEPVSISEINNTINCIFRDREGIIWIGAEHLEKYDFRNYKVGMTPLHMKEAGNTIFSHYDNIYRCADGRFLLGGYLGMALYDPSSGYFTKIKSEKLQMPAPHVFRMVTAIQEDEQGNIWCTNWPHFCHLKLHGNEVVDLREYTYPFGFSYGDLKLDGNGHLLTGTLGKGMLVFNISDSSYTTYDTSSKSPARLCDWRVSAIFPSRSGAIWLGTPRGIDKIEKDGRHVKHYPLNNAGVANFAEFNVGDIQEDKNGLIWFTSDDGLGRIDPATDSFSFSGIREGLPTNKYNKLCIDDTGNLWAVSKVGILRLNTMTMQNQLYTEQEGFPVADEIRDICYSKYSKKLYMLTEYAIYEVDPQSYHSMATVPATLITGFKVFEKEKPYGANNKITLNYNENFITISFAGLLFHSNEQIKYAYQLYGVDANWVYCNFRRNATYSDLAPGHYKFGVKAQSPEGLWSSTPTFLEITIVPPYWQTWWFESLEVILSVVFILWVVRLYILRKLAQQKIEFEKQNAVSAERMRIAADMHDELGSGLTSIRFLSELAGKKLSNDIAAKNEIEKIESSSARLSENLREIIWTMNTKFDKLDDFIIYVRIYAVQYFDESPINFRFISPEVIPEIPLKGELRRNVFLCIKEALHNIIKHSRASEASLSFTIRTNQLTIEIKDNGVGFDSTQINKFGNGLITMKERLNKCKSTLKIEGSNGTKLIFNINF